MRYVATFYSHFGAISFKRACEARGLPARLMPVPRYLSSSCGTCVSFEADSFNPSDVDPEEVELVAEDAGPGGRVLYSARGGR